jgi:hypothetical protein
MINKYIIRSPRTASRIWSNFAIVVLMPNKSNNPLEKIFKLGLDGAYIWRLLEKKCKVREIIISFAEKKKIGFNVARKQVLRILTQLDRKKLVEMQD